MKIVKYNETMRLGNAEIVHLTKDDARELLTHNTKNRKINRQQVKMLKRAMNDGKWMFNGESIVVDIDGNLVSGQHRMTAFLESDMETFTTVFVHLYRNENVLLSLNKGKITSTGEMLNILGHKSGTYLAATAKNVISLEVAVKNNANIDLTERVPDHVIKDYIDNHPVLEEFCLTSKKDGRSPRASIMAVLVYSAIVRPDLAPFLLRTLKNLSSMVIAENSLEHGLVKLMANTLGAGGTYNKMCAEKTMSLVAYFLTNKCEPTRVYGMEPSRFNKALVEADPTSVAAL